MENLMVFENEEFGSMKVLFINNEEWFIASEVSENLGYTTLQKMYTHIDAEDKMKINPQSEQFKGLCQNGTSLTDNPNVFTMMLINESGLYSAILSSKLPSAKKFKRWVTSVILPSIRRNEGYIRNQETMSSEELLAKSNLMTQKIIAEKDSKIQQLEPQAQNYRLLMDTKGNIDFADFVKVAKLSEGRNTFMSRLRREKILMKNSTTPRQNYIERGYFEVVQGIATNGHSIVKTTITKKGQDWLIKKCNQWKLIANDLQQVN